MEVLYKLIHQRLYLLQESLDASEKVLQKKINWMDLKRSLHLMKKTEKEIQVHEDENLQIIQGKNEFSKQDRSKFHKNMRQAILKLCPQISQLNIQCDGKHRNICVIFMQFYNHLAMHSKVQEVKQIYENKLYDKIPLIYQLTKTYIQISRKIIGNQFKFVIFQLKQIEDKWNSLQQQRNNKVQSSTFMVRYDQNEYMLLQPTSGNETTDLQPQLVEKKQGFKRYLKIINQAIPDALIDEIPHILYTATAKYRSLLMRNLEIKQSINFYQYSRDKNKQQIQTQDGKSPNFVFHSQEHQDKLNGSFKFWFMYDYGQRPNSPNCELRPRSQQISPQHGSQQTIRIKTNQKSRESEFQKETALRKTFFPDISKSQQTLKLTEISRSYERVSTRLRARKDLSIDKQRSQDQKEFDSEQEVFHIKKQIKKKHPNPISLQRHLLQFENDNLETIYEKRKKNFPSDKFELLGKGQKIEPQYKPTLKKKKQIDDPSKVEKINLDIKQ